MKVKIFNICFVSVYLGIILSVGCFLLITRDDLISKLWGLMALVLFSGDIFGLVARVKATFNPDKDYTVAIGRGKQITSISMAVFFVILWHIGLLAYGHTYNLITALMYFLAICRVILCFMPQNRWTSPVPNYSWGFYRNIPLFLMGMIVASLFGVYSGCIPHLNFMFLAIILSFIFYLPVVLYSNHHPRVKLLMIPRTLMYLWIILMGI